MNTTGLGRQAVTSLAFAVLVMVPGLAAADDAADCAKETGEDAIAACTRRIESGGVNGHELAVMLDHRGLAMRRKGDIDRAIADFDEAIRRAPNFAEPVFRRAVIVFAGADVAASAIEMHVQRRWDGQLTEKTRDAGKVRIGNSGAVVALRMSGKVTQNRHRPLAVPEAHE